jgi:hypothetical protein
MNCVAASCSVVHLTDWCRYLTKIVASDHGWTSKNNTKDPIKLVGSLLIASCPHGTLPVTYTDNALEFSTIPS